MIPAEPVHYVKNYDEVRPGLRHGIMLGSQKHDGVYCFLKNKQSYSRTGKPYPSGNPLARTAYNLLPGHIIIGEFMLYNHGRALPVNEISGAFRRMEECGAAYLIIHDIIPEEDFGVGLCLIPFDERIRTWDTSFHARPGGNRFITNEQTLLTGEEAHRAYAKGHITIDHEGAVFKVPQGIWQAGKKNELQLKIVRKLSYDLRVNGVYEGKGKYVGTLGGLILEFRKYGKPDGEMVLIRADGMTDDKRHLWYSQPGRIVGKIIKIECMQFTANGVLRQPKCKELRHDKITPDLEWS